MRWTMLIVNLLAALAFVFVASMLTAANRTQRLVDGRPANYDDPVIQVGASEVYEARCRACHEVPGKPKRGASE